MRKKTCNFDFLVIPKLKMDENDKIIELIVKSRNKIISYNKIMKAFEENSNLTNGFIFVCDHDSSHDVIFQSLPLFCDYRKINLYSLAKGSRNILEKQIGRKNILIVFIPHEDELFNEIQKTISEFFIDNFK